MIKPKIEVKKNFAIYNLPPYMPYTAAPPSTFQNNYIFTVNFSLLYFCLFLYSKTNNKTHIIFDYF